MSDITATAVTLSINIKNQHYQPMSPSPSLSDVAETSINSNDWRITAKAQTAKTKARAYLRVRHRPCPMWLRPPSTAKTGE